MSASAMSSKTLNFPLAFAIGKESLQFRRYFRGNFLHFLAWKRFPLVDVDDDAVKVLLVTRNPANVRVRDFQAERQEANPFRAKSLLGRQPYFPRGLEVLPEVRDFVSPVVVLFWNQQAVTPRQRPDV